MTNGITYDPTRQCWLVQCGSTAVPVQFLDKNNKPVPAPATASAKQSSRANDKQEKQP